ncbi:MAG: O-antigen ligase family protein [Gammaproteobacteria bacterium]
MKILLRKIESEWPAWTAIAFVALLPVRRLSELPLVVFALALPFLARSRRHRERVRAVAVWVTPLFLAYWLPMLLSSFDSYDPGKSWGQTLAAIRFPMAAISVAVLLHPRSLRWKFLLWSSLILVFWAADGFIQLIFGYDLFGVPAHEDRLNALFFTRHQFYGPVMAMLSPLLLEYARRHWPGWAWAGSFALVMGAVMIAGMRSGWLAMAMVIGVYGILMLRRENRELRRITLAIPAIAIIVIALSYAVSPLFQQRVAATLAITAGTEEAVDLASSLRVPIFRNSLRMYEAHPVNGVGVRAFPVAYLEFADPDDPHVAATGGKRGATHAHNVVLEVLADTGTIGLLAWLAGTWFGWRRWGAMTPDQRQEAFPFVLALGLVLFPLNTHFAIYGTYLSSLIWMLVGLWLSAGDETVRAPDPQPRASEP